MNKPNKLISEKSPYLLQHAYNPVDWHAWNDEAFDKAKKENKPVFLSIGYSTCHWCHVMEKESFEDPEVAALMNEAFVSVKVDREERPDIDGIYMTVCQMLTGSGGWPMTIIMTPGKKPFFAGTYIPKHNKFGRPGMMDLIPKIREVWETRHDDVISSAGEITKALSEAAPDNSGELNKDILNTAFNDFKKRFDNNYGGFGNAPKFPTPHNLLILLRYRKQTGDEHALAMVTHTLTEMRKGGIYDHIGFGFHRYSTDAKWLVPHFEKMLYDQALLAMAYTDGYLATNNLLFKQTAEEILEYVLRDMTSPAGGFYSAEDADSEGVEGKFYLWTEEELHRLLKDDADTAIKYFNVLPGGNWVDPVHGTEDGTNILHITKTDEECAGELNMPVTELKERMKRIKELLFNNRKKRIHPYKDDKILTDWNALMISAFARAAQAFDNPAYTAAAEKAMLFILKHLAKQNGELLHRYRDGEAGLPAHIDDYAFLVSALLDLYETTFNLEYMQKAIQLSDYMRKHFFDKSGGAFFFTSDLNEELIARQKEIYDGAVPSGNSTAILNLVRLSGFTGNTSYEDDAVKVLNAFAVNINSAPSAYALALCGISFLYGKSMEVVLSGDPESPESKKLLKVIRETYNPNKAVLFREQNQAKSYDSIAPFTKNFAAAEGKTMVYICENFTCSLPVSDETALRELLLK